MSHEDGAVEPELDPPKEWFDRLHRSFRDESDRAAAIVAASMLEANLSDMIAAFLRPVKSGARPIRTRFLGESIGAAEQLGLISPQFATDLGTIQEIRNFFAHHPDSVGFRDPKLKGLVDRLKKAHFATGPDVDWVNESGPRGDYLICVSWMLWCVTVIQQQVGTIVEPAPEFGYWPEAVRAAQEAVKSKT